MSGFDPLYPVWLQLVWVLKLRVDAEAFESPLRGLGFVQPAALAARTGGA